MDDIKERALYLGRLVAWREELETNKHGMQKYAERTVKLLQSEIKRKWPLGNQE